MATYAIGDIQGCLEPLERLLDQLDFRPGPDRLWLTGDLVNRGPDSAAVVRMIRSLGEHATTVLGNHDLHLLAVRYGSARLKRRDTLDELLDAPDSEDLLEWLKHQPLAHFDADLDTLLVHAGCPPEWNVDEVLQRAAEVETALRSDSPEHFFRDMYGDQPDRWHSALNGLDRLRFITNALTRMRFVDAEGRLDMKHKGPPGSQPKGWLPWFDFPRASQPTRIVFGHWSMLGLRTDSRIIGLDTGCLWGRQLTAVRLEDGVVFSVECPLMSQP